MSSRALKRLQNDCRLSELPVVVDDGHDDGSQHDKASDRPLDTSYNRQLQARENIFELLNGSDVQDEEAEKEEKPNTDDSLIFSVKENLLITKKKKKKKKNIKLKEQDIVHIQEQEPVDEIEASIQEVNRILGEPESAAMQRIRTANFSVIVKSLLHIDFRHLNPEAELKRMFGSEVIRGEQSRRIRRQRNRPLHRSSRLVQLRDNWHGTGGSGLSMKYIEETQEFVFEHSLAYQKLQHKFSDAVDSGHPENIINILTENPYHVDSLIQMAELHRINEDYQTSAESVEKALYGLECAFHPMFNLATGKCYLSYKRPENRALFLCLFKHILNLGRRGCNRTSFEFCKLLLSLDPAGDPLDCMNIIDYLALRCEQYDYLVELEQENLDSMKHVPNFSMSIPLAYFKNASRKSGDTSTADCKMQDTLLFFPMMLLPLLDECSVQPDKRVQNHPFFNIAELSDSSSELGRLVKMYVKRCVACWKEAEVIAWLERNVMAVLDIVNEGKDHRLQNYPKLRQQRFRHPPLSLLRHYFLSEIPGVGLPRRFMMSAVLNHDPFPPPDSIVSYIRPTRPTVASQNQNGFFMSILQSLLPSYNPYEPVDEARRRHHRSDDDNNDARAQGIPQQIQESVNAVMQAMRQLLADPFAAQPPVDNADNPDLEENEREWEDEQ